ncbi:MAG: sulfatase-like hydrolase/transferase, partial [Planctomycetaceae bacterium]|nr:sulfatase-like hydrolase/transferase [Planctomycetaceae bacterium]
DHQIVWNRPGQPENAGNYFYDQILTINGTNLRVPGYSTDNYTQWAVEYIQGENRDPKKPWYLWLCYGAIHGPTTPADRHEGKLAGNSAPVPADIFGPWPQKPDYLNSTQAWEQGGDGKPYRKSKKVDSTNFNTNTAGQSYDDWVQQSNECAMALDESVGRLMDALRDSGQLDNTIIIYAADQGFALGEHGMNNKVAPYDATVASPMMISYSGKIPQDKVCRHPINAPDVVQLLCHYTGLTLPWRTDGRDIRPLIAQPELTDWDQPMLMTHTGRKYGADTESLPDHEAMYEVGGIPWYVLLRQGKYKYIRTLVEGEIEEIYDLDEDPEELNNLAVKSEYHSLLSSLRETAIKELHRTDAKLDHWMPVTAAMKE